MTLHLKNRAVIIVNGAYVFVLESVKRNEPLSRGHSSESDDYFSVVPLFICMGDNSAGNLVTFISDL